MTFFDFCFGEAGSIIFLAFILPVSIVITTVNNNIYNYGYKYRQKKKYKLLKQIPNSLLLLLLEKKKKKFVPLLMTNSLLVLLLLHDSILCVLLRVPLLTTLLLTPNPVQVLLQLPILLLNLILLLLSNPVSLRPNIIPSVLLLLSPIQRVLRVLLLLLTTIQHEVRKKKKNRVLLLTNPLPLRPKTNRVLLLSNPVLLRPTTNRVLLSPNPILLLILLLTAIQRVLRVLLRLPLLLLKLVLLLLRGLLRLPILLLNLVLLRLTINPLLLVPKKIEISSNHILLLLRVLLRPMIEVRPTIEVRNNNDCTAHNNNECTAYCNNNDVVHDVIQCDLTNSSVVLGQVPRNITYNNNNNNNNNNIHEYVPNDSKRLMLMTKIFNVTVYDVDVDTDTYCGRNCDHDDDQDNDSDIVRDINERTTHQVHQSLFYNYGVATDCDHAHILSRCTVRCGNSFLDNNNNNREIVCGMTCLVYVSFAPVASLALRLSSDHTLHSIRRPVKNTSPKSYSGSVTNSFRVTKNNDSCTTNVRSILFCTANSNNSFLVTKYPSSKLQTTTNELFCSINRDTDRDLVNYGVVYAHENAYAVVQLLFYNLQGFDRYNNGHTYDVIYDICVFNNNDTPSSGYLCNNNGTNNDTPDCISGVENDRSDTMRYGNNNISFIDIYCLIMVHLAYNSVALVTTLETISSSYGRDCVRLSSEITPVPSFSSTIFRLLSGLFHLSSDCGLVHLEHVTIVLVASPETISSLSSPSLSPVSSFLCSSSPGLYSCSSSSHTKCPSYIPFSCQILNLVVGSSITPITRCFTRHIYDILFLKFNH